MSVWPCYSYSIHKCENLSAPVMKMPLSWLQKAIVPSKRLLRTVHQDPKFCTSNENERFNYCHQYPKAELWWKNFWILLFYFLRTEMGWLWVHLEKFIEISFFNLQNWCSNYCIRVLLEKYNFFIYLNGWTSTENFWISKGLQESYCRSCSEDKLQNMNLTKQE